MSNRSSHSQLLLTPMRSHARSVVCLIGLVALVPLLGGCLVRLGVTVVRENGTSQVSADGQLGIHPLGLVRSVARHADAGFGMTFRGPASGRVGLYVEGALVMNKTPLAPASPRFDVFDLRQMVALDATLTKTVADGSQLIGGPLRPGVDALLVTEAAGFYHVNTKREIGWGEIGGGLYLSGRFDRRSWGASLGLQARLCACIPGG